MRTGHAAQHWVEALTWPEVEQRVAGGAIALLPIGAGAKEHGFHLPHGTDAIQARYYAEVLARRFDGLIWPLVAYGYYPVFTDYPGSISLSETSFKDVVGDILAGIANCGVRAIAIINTGISTIAPLAALLDERACGVAVRLVNCYAGPRFAAGVAAQVEQAFGGHADEVETALMLAIDPARVRSARAVAQATPIVRGRFNRRDPAGPNYSPSGANGDPTRATAAKGQALLAALIDDLQAELREFIAAL